MKASVFDWVKLLLDNSKVVYPLIILLLSATGLSTYSSYEKNVEIVEKDIEIEASHNQLIAVANHLAPAKSECKSCDKLMLDHKREYHQ